MLNIPALFLLISLLTILMLIVIYFFIYDDIPTKSNESNKSNDNKVLDYIKSPKYNFVSTVVVDTKNNVITVKSDNTFNMFQVWSPLHKKENEKRYNYNINKQNLTNLINSMKRNLNFEPTIFITVDNKYIFGVCKSVKMVGENMELHLKDNLKIELENKEVILYIDSSSKPPTSGNLSGTAYSCGI